MSRQVNPAKLKAAINPCDSASKAHWNELQHLQYTLGIWDGIEGSSVRHRTLPARNWIVNDEWRSLRGILRDRSGRSTTEMKAEEKSLELAHDEWKFGPFPKQ